MCFEWTSNVSHLVASRIISSVDYGHVSDGNRGFLSVSQCMKRTKQNTTSILAFGMQHAQWQDVHLSPDIRTRPIWWITVSQLELITKNLQIDWQMCSISLGNRGWDLHQMGGLPCLTHLSLLLSQQTRSLAVTSSLSGGLFERIGPSNAQDHVRSHRREGDYFHTWRTWEINVDPTPMEGPPFSPCGSGDSPGRGKRLRGRVMPSEGLCLSHTSLTWKDKTVRFENLLRGWTVVVSLHAQHSWTIPRGSWTHGGYVRGQGYPVIREKLHWD